MAVVHTQLAYILHKRPYRESSQILDIFTREHGRISLMSRGSRAARSRTAGSLQLFSPLLVSWQGRSSLPSLRNVERADIKPPGLVHKAMFSALYLNELLTYLLHDNDPQQAIFDLYHHSLYDLAQTDAIEMALRHFEIELLSQLGFALEFAGEAGTGEPVHADRAYCYVAGHGVVDAAHAARFAGQAPVSVAGATLLDLAARNYDAIGADRDRQRQVKHMMRHILAFHLGGRKLKSRALFAMPEKSPVGPA